MRPTVTLHRKGRLAHGIAPQSGQSVVTKCVGTLQLDAGVGRGSVNAQDRFSEHEVNVRGRFLEDRA